MKFKSGFLLLALLTMFACNGPDEKESTIDRLLSSDTLPRANGGILDIIVVCEDALWQGDVGSAFEEHFISMAYGLPQAEPRFIVRQIDPSEFGKLLQRARYVFLIGIDGEESKIDYQNNRWAKGQLVVNVTSNNEEELTALIKRNRKAMGQKIEDLESIRLTKKIKPLTLSEYPKFFEKHGLKLAIPKDFAISVAEEDVVVYWKSTSRADNGILIYVGDLPADAGIIGNEIVPLRDSLVKLYVPGEKEESYMITEDLIKPQFNPMDFKDHFSIEARGLWRTVGDIMGGPFVSYTIYDEDNDRLIYIETFMFAPQKKKRRSLFELESIIRGLEIN